MDKPADTTRQTRGSDDTRTTENDALREVGERIQRAIQEKLHARIVVASTADTVYLDGRVSTPDLRAHVERLAHDMAPGKRVENAVEVEQLLSATEANPREEASEVLGEPNANRLSDAPSTTALEQQDTADVDAGVPGLAEDTDELDDPTLQRASGGLDASLTDQPLETNAIDVVDDSVYDADDPAEPDPAYFAPTDPLVGSGMHGNLTVVNGLEPTSTTEDTVDVSASDNLPGDEALADAIRRELREDATTTDLDVSVEVTDGVAHLHGSVPSVDDAENAEWVASEVPGVVDVDEHLDIQDL